MSTLKVVCCKWKNVGPKRTRVEYTAEHVNVFARMVRRHLSMPHEIVCVTDDTDGIDPSISIVPLWDDAADKGGCYRRLKLFSKEMRALIGERFVSIDLDCVITGPLDPLFNHDHDFIAWGNVSNGSIYCGSMFMMTAGARFEVWDLFDPNDLVMSSNRVDKSHPGGRWIHPKSVDAGNVIGSDQAWISTVLGDKEPMWTKRDGVMSFKKDVGYARMSRLKRRRANTKNIQLPDSARIVFFHGFEDPSQRHIQLAAPWIKEYWR